MCIFLLATLSAFPASLPASFLVSSALLCSSRRARLFLGLFPGNGSRKDPSRSRASLLFFSTDRARQSFPGVLSESRSRELFQSLLFSDRGSSPGSPCKRAFPTGVLMDVLMELRRNASSRSCPQRSCADTPAPRLVALRHNCLLTRARTPFYPSRRQGLFPLQPHLL